MTRARWPIYHWILGLAKLCVLTGCIVYSFLFLDAIELTHAVLCALIVAKTYEMVEMSCVSTIKCFH